MLNIEKHRNALINKVARQTYFIFLKINKNLWPDAAMEMGRTYLFFSVFVYPYAPLISIIQWGKKKGFTFVWYILLAVCDLHIYRQY